MSGEGGGDEKRDFFNKTENLFVGEGLLEVGFKENLWYLCIFHSVLTHYQIRHNTRVCMDLKFYQV